MKIYILKEYNTERTFCVSENIHMIKKCLLNKYYFNREYNDYPILIIWENGEEIEHIYGNDVYKRVLNQLFGKQG